MLELAGPENGKYIRRLLHAVSQGYVQQVAPLPLGDLLQHRRHLPIPQHGRDELAARVIPDSLLKSLGSLEAALVEYTVGRETHALRPAHRDDVTLKVAHRRVPHVLVDDEGRRPWQRTYWFADPTIQAGVSLMPR